MPWNLLAYFRSRHKDLDDEMRAHLAMAIEDRIAHGETPAEADLNARREFGNEVLIKQTTRDVWQWQAFEDWGKNFYYALRRLRRDPGFGVLAVLTLAFGLGSVTTIFSIVNGVLMRPLQYPNSSSLYVARTVTPTGDFPVNARHAHEWRMQCSACEDVALVRFEELTLTEAGDPVRLPTFAISANFFRTLGVQPAMGKDFSDDREAGRGQVILSNRVWRERFREDAQIVGRAIRLNGELRTVVAVMPANLHLPKGDEWGSIFGPNEPALLFSPLGLDAKRVPIKGGLNFNAIIRLKPDIGLHAAEEELSAISAGLMEPDPLMSRTSLTALTHQITRNVRSALWLLLIAVGLVLLIVCLNVGNLMLIRTAARTRETGIRIALGASGGHLFLLVLTEALLFSAIATVLGLFITIALLRTFATHALATLPRAAEVQMDWRVMTFSVAAAALSAIVCCLAPAWKLWRTDPLDSLKTSSATAIEPSHTMNLREWIVGLEIALSTVLLMSAGLLAMSFFRIMSDEKGFEVARVITQDVSFLSPKYARGARRQVVEDLTHKLAAIPGVKTVGAVNHLPLLGEDWVADLADADAPPMPQESPKPTANFRFITPDYLRGMGVDLKRGRMLTEGDKNQLRVVISELAAQQLWPGLDPIGRHVRGMGGRTQPALEVVGVVSEVPAGGVDQSPTFTVYEHYWRMQPVGMSFALRTEAHPATVARAVGIVLAKADPEMAIQPAVTMEEILNKSVALRRLQTTLATAFAGAALLLALLGIYGVISFAVARRTPEIGIRVALGAQRTRLVALVMRQGLRPVAIGLAIGVPAGLAANRLIANRLYKVTPDDPGVAAAVILLLVFVAAAACCVPAWSATRIDPAVALRFE